MPDIDKLPLGKDAEKRGKRKDFYRVCANELVKSPYRLKGYSDFMENTYPTLERYATLYKENTEKKKLFLADLDRGLALILKSRNRFTVSYMKEVSKTVMGIPVLITEGKLSSHALFVVLTINPALFGSLPDVHRNASKELNKMLTRIRHEYPKIHYIRTYETQENGMLHVNLMIFGMGFMNKQFFMDYWKRMSESGWCVQLRYFTGARMVLVVSHYILKYIVKTQISDKASDLGVIPHRDKVIGWACNWRSYSISRKLRAMLVSFSGNTTNKSNWEYISCLTDLEFAGSGLFELKHHPELLTYIENKQSGESRSGGNFSF